MKYIFWHKSNMLSIAIRATKFFLVISIMLYSTSAFSSEEPSKIKSSIKQNVRSAVPVSKNPPSSLFSIEDILPRKVHPGDPIEIYLSLNFLKYNKNESIRVVFDDFRGKIVFFRMNVLGVEVPPDLPSDKIVSVVVGVPGFKTQPFQIKVVSRLAILNVFPPKAHPGDSIQIIFNKDISEYFRNRTIRVVFDGFPGVILSDNLDTLRVQIPKDFRPNKNVSAVAEIPGFKTMPYKITVLPGNILARIWEFIINPLYLITVFFFTVIIVLVFLLWRMHSRKLLLQKSIENLQSSSKEEPKEGFPVTTLTKAEMKIEPPQIPDELITACQKGECIVFVGADLSKPAGFPDWQEFVQKMLQWALDSKILDPSLGVSYHGVLQSGQADLVADGIVSAVQTGEGPVKDIFIEYLKDVFVRPSAKPTTAYRLLKQIGFTGALTTNLDSLLENALKAPVFTLQDAQKLLPKLAERESFILKLSGVLERPETVQISPAQYRDNITDNRVFIEFVEKLFLSRTLLFVGTNLDGIQSNLEAFGLRNVHRLHYALVGVSGSEWRAKAESLQRRFGFQILPYSTSDEDAVLVNFLRMLATQVSGDKSAVMVTPSETPLLRSIHLNNIGPFDTLDLQFNSNWNILLGNNGVGKSNILKAIALALCGKNAQPFADRLLKYGTTSGEIVMELIDGTRNSTMLYRTNSGTEIKAITQRELLGTERWLAMAFPPLRQLGWAGPKGPQPKPGTPYTIPGDLIPLISGDPDPRMTDLKQSILNYDYQGRMKGGERYKKLLADFFYVMVQITQGVTLRGWKIDQKKTWRIYVETDDGWVPLEAVSQGTQSLIGWIGLMLERLYEIYENMDHPREGPGLVLIDEIDAHMHPLWQQKIVHTLSELFPKVQFIATTHSPLIVGGMPMNQVVRFKRDEKGMVIKARIDEDMTSGRADQVLTGSLFGLPTTLDAVTQDKIKEYQALLGKTTRTETEEHEFQELRKVLQFRIPVPYETPSDRRALELVEALLMQQALEAVPGKQPSLLKQVRDRALESAKQLLGEIQRQQEAEHDPRTVRSLTTER